MADSRRLCILKRVKALLQGVTIAQGYRTDLGQHVLLYEMPTFGPDDVKVAAAVVPIEDIKGEGDTERKLHLTLPVNVHVQVSPSSVPEDQIGQLLEEALADVKEAMEADDQELLALLRAGRNNPTGMTRGTTETFSSVSGSEFTGFLVTYLCKYDEAWGQPEA